MDVREEGREAEGVMTAAIAFKRVLDLIKGRRAAMIIDYP